MAFQNNLGWKGSLRVVCLNHLLQESLPDQVVHKCYPDTTKEMPLWNQNTGEAWLSCLHHTDSLLLFLNNCMLCMPEVLSHLKHLPRTNASEGLAPSLVYKL